MMKKSTSLILLYAATTRVFVDFVGRVMLAELLALIYMPFSNVVKNLRRFTLLKVVVSLLFALLLVQMLSDIVNETSVFNALRGWAVIIFAMISTIYLVNNLSNNRMAVFYYLFALFVVRLAFGDGELDIAIMEVDTNYFKKRFMGFINPAMMLIACYLFFKKKILLSSVALLLYGFLSISLDGRANGVVFILAGMFLLLKKFEVNFNVRRVWLSTVSVLGAGYMLYALYAYQVLSYGLGGSNAQSQMSMMSNPYNPLELLYYGRPEISVLFQAFMDKPLLGFGSWAEDPNHHYAKMITLLTGVEGSDYVGYIRAHSILLGYSAYAGLGASVILIVLFYKLLMAALFIYRQKINSPTLPALLVITIYMIWDFIFSPIGHLRLSFPFFAALIIVEFHNISVHKSYTKS